MPRKTKEQSIKPTVNDLVENSELFKGIKDEAALQRIAQKSSFCTLQPNEPLQHKRGKVNYIYIILEGFVEIHLHSDVLKGYSFLAWRGPKQIIGEMRLMADEREQAVVTSHEQCKFIEIPGDQFIEEADKNPLLYKNLVKLVIKKTFQERKRAEVIQMPDGIGKIAQTIINIYEERNITISDKRFVEVVGNNTIIGAIHQEDVSGYIGPSRTSVSRKLAVLKRAGIIYYPGRGRVKSPRQISIIDFDALKECAKLNRIPTE